MTPSPTCYFFGTFNPIHMGHLVMAQCALNQYGKRMGFQTVTFVPAGNPPHRQNDLDLAGSLDRYRMVMLATGSNPAFRVSDVELHQPGPTYTYDMLEQLCPEVLESGQPVPMIIGSDAFKTLGTWHKAKELVQAATFLQVPRPGVPFTREVVILGRALPVHTELVDMPELAISSTWVRARLREGQALRYLLPRPVLSYIRDNRLYRS